MTKMGIMRLIKLTGKLFVCSILFFFHNINVAFSNPVYESAVTNSVGWLEGAQNQDGSWGTENDIKPLYTAEAVLALKATNNFNAAYYRGITWLENHDSPNIDYKTRRIRALNNHGDNTQSDVQFLQQSQQTSTQENGGWGLSPVYDGATIDSALVLLAYSEINETTNVQAALDFLKAAQLTDSPNNQQGWALGQESISDIITTAKVLQALVAHLSTDPSLSTNITNAITTISSQINATTSDLVKGSAALALLRENPSSTLAQTYLNELLLEQSGVDGSWGQNEYITAVITRALAAANGTDSIDLSTVVYIPDAKLRAAINLALGKNVTDAITKGEIQKLTDLNLSNLGVTDLTGLEEATNLTTINLEGNDISDLSQIQSLPNIITPLSPTVITGTAIPSDTYADISGTINPNGFNTTIYFEWGTDTNYGNTTIPESVGNGSSNITVTNTITPLTNETTYHYRIVASNPAETSVGNDTFFTTLSAINENPAATDDAALTTEEKAVIIDVLNNDNDKEGDNLSIVSVTTPSTGLVVNNGSDISYTPEINFTGVDTFSYTVDDGNGGTSSAMVTVSVVPRNIYTYYILNPNATLGQSHVISLVDNNTIQSGSTTLMLNRYESGIIPAIDLAQGAPITGTGPFDVANEVFGVNMPVPASFAGLNFVLPEVLGNTSNNILYLLSPYGDATASLGSKCGDTTVSVLHNTVSTVTEGSLGSAVEWGCTVNSDLPIVVAYKNDIQFAPLALLPAKQDLWGFISRSASVAAMKPGTNVTAYASDGSNMSYIIDQDPVTIDVGINNDQGRGSAIHLVADGPIAAVQLDDGDGIAGSVFFDTNSHAKRFSIPVETQYIAASCSESNTTITLYDGVNTPQVEICEGSATIPGKAYFGGASNGVNINADVYLEADKPFHILYEVSATDQEHNLLGTANNSPLALNDVSTIDEDIVATIDVLANDSDIDEDELTIVSVTQGTNGVVTNNSTDLTYTPNTNFNGVDSFTYTIDDGNGQVDTALVTITVTPDNDDPVATNDSDNTSEDTPVTILVLLNDSDSDGDALSIVGVTQGATGTVAFTTTDVTYTPNADFNGSDSFTYTVSDGNGGLDTGTVNVFVSGTQDPPVAFDDIAVTNEDVQIVLDVLTNDTDVDGDSLTVTGATQGTNGAVTSTTNNVTYTPNADFNGGDSFTYTISDGNGGTDTATVNVTVNPVNDAPSVVGDGDTTDEDTAIILAVLANDADIDGDTLSITSVTTPQNGVAVSDGTTITYTPAADFTGLDSFTYTASDGNGGTAIASVAVMVSAINDEPVATNDIDITSEDTATTITVLLNDTDVDGDSLTVSAVTQGTNGSVTHTANDVTYTPAADFNGADSFTYTISDGNGESDTATVNVTVTAVNDAPVSSDDSDSTNEDTATTVTVLSNDTDVDGDTLTVSAVTQGTNGSVTHTANDVTYTPAADFNGADSFTYTISDGNGESDTATVNVTVTAVNDAPVAVVDSDTTDEDTAKTLTVLSNDTDVEGDSLTVSAVTQGTNGSVTHTANDVTYTPAADFNGADSFSYTISDGNGGADTATVSITVTAVNDAPVAVVDSDTTDEDTAKTLTVLTNDSDIDGDTLTVTAITQGTNGSVTHTANDVTYTPAADFNGADSFTYTISDGNGESDTATVNVTVTAVNDAPVAVVDSDTTDEDTAKTLTVLSNDTDVEGDSLTVSAVTQGTNGSVTHTANDVTYTPAADFNGADSFTYTISDGNGGADTATVSITVTAVNDAPVAVVDSDTTDEDTAKTLTVLTNDSDIDGDTLTVTAITQGTNGSVTHTANDVTYTPAADFNGADSFTYTISDGNGESDTATVNVTVTAVNDAPVAVVDSDTTDEDTAKTLTVLSNDTDVEGDSLTVSAVTQGTNGSVTHTANDVTYTPAADFNGADSFTYTISDGNGGTDTATVSITVDPINDNPNAVNDTNITGEDMGLVITVLTNDSDIDGDTLAVTAITQGTNGSVTHTANDVTYTPAADFNGADSFTYTISDGNGGADTATVSITVTAVNDAPVAVVDSDTTDEDTAKTLTVLTNDSDIDGDTLTVTAITQGTNGSVTHTANDVTYTPAADFNGADSFTYTISDGNGESDTATVNVTVTAVNDAPVAVVDSDTTDEDTAKTLTVLSNDTDVEGDSLTVSAVTQGTNGSVTHTANDVTYTPAADFNGADSFTYTISDGNGGTDTATVSITVTAVNDAPVAVVDSDTTDEDTAKTLTVLTNDSDIDGDTLTVTAITQGTNGSVTHTANDVTYTPAADFNGADSFTYTISDGNGESDTATVNVTVTAVNDAPVAVVDSDTTDEDTAKTLTVLSNDTDVEGDSLTVSAVTQGTNGSVTHTANDVTYTPAADFNGADSFTYTISDGNGGTDTATVSITVTAVNDAPVAVVDSDTTDEDTAKTLTVLTNDSDIDGDTLTVTAITQGTNGSVTHTANDVTYTPAADFNGADSFTYTISDGNGESDTATVNVTVTAVNDAPVAVVDSDTTDEDTAKTLTVLSNDTDVEGDSLTVSAVTQGTNGSVTHTANDVTYTPAADFNGADSFTYTISDGNGGTDTATVSITVTAVNDAPVAVVDSDTTDEDTAKTLTVLTNDSDIDGDTLTVTAITQGTNGSVTHTANDVTYTPAADFNGADSFTYTISDGNGESDTATVNVTVTAVNDAPVAVVDSDTTDEDTAKTLTVLSNDTDVEGDSLTVSAVTQGTNGSVTHTVNDVTYTPAADFNGADSFTYTVSDGNGGTDTATVNIVITPINDDPFLIGDGVTTNEDTQITIDVLANDTDIDGDSLTIASITQPTTGSASTDGNTITFTPLADFNGLESFTYTASDGNGGSAIASVAVMVSAENDDPVANDDSAITVQDIGITINVLENDTDIEADTLSVSATTQGTNGLVFNEGAAVSYLPNTDFSGNDSFTYTLSDGNGGTAIATVNVTVNPREHNTYHVLNPELGSGPLNVVSLEDGNVITAGDTTLNLDKDQLGTIPAVDLSQGSIINGSHSFSIGASTNATDMPVPASFAGTEFVIPQNQDEHHYFILSLYGDTDVTIEAGSGPINVLALENQVIEVNAGSINGTATLITSNSPVLVVHAGFNTSNVLDRDVYPVPPASMDIWGARSGAVVGALEANTTVTVYASDGMSNSFTLQAAGLQTVSIGNDGANNEGDTLHIVADKPIAAVQHDDSDGEETTAFLDSKYLGVRFGIPVDTQYVSVTAPDADTVITLFDGANSPQTIVTNGDGVIPGKAYFGNSNNGTHIGAGAIIESNKPIFVIYEVSATNDEHNLLGIIAEPDPNSPVANIDNVTIDEDTIANVVVLANDIDTSGTGLTVSSVTDGAYGTVVINGDQSVSYTPNTDFFGIDNFTYTITDGNGMTDMSAVIVTVDNLNDPPSPVDDNIVIDEDTSMTIDVLSNDTDTEDDTLTITSVTQGNNGAVVNNNTDVSYTPILDFNGADTFTYTVSDGNGGITIATVNVTINPINDSPTITVNEPLTLIEGNTATITSSHLAGDDPDDSSAEITYTVAIGATQGQLEFSDNPGIAITSFTQADIDTNRVVYVHTIPGPVVPPPTAEISLIALDGNNGMTINGAAPGDASGMAVSTVGDVNGDGISDFILAASYADPNGAQNAGQSYVVYGELGGLPANLDVLNLDGTNGFTINGITIGDVSGGSVSAAGDVNNDGYDDIIIGARWADPNGLEDAGQAYIIFGDLGLPTSINLTSLNGTNGFSINGAVAFEETAHSVSNAGDVNNDNIDDFIIGSSYGNSYVIFGQASGFASSIELSSLNGVNGFMLNGVSGGTNGNSVSSAGDVNGDGIDDLIIGASSASPNGLNSGQSYVVFGQSTGFASVFELSSLDGANGFTINGVKEGDQSGWAVSNAGDINNDGFADIIIGAPWADPYGTSSGQSYVVFGKGTAFLSSLELSSLNGTSGFTLNGIAVGDFSGISVSAAGEVNGDGIDDIIIGAYLADPNGVANAGQSYVIYGQTSAFSSTLNLAELDGNNGKFISGTDANTFSGAAVSGSGDVDNDGLDDLIIGVPLADPHGKIDAGQSHIIYGE